MPSDFVHLHVHTEYSMLDGAARLADLFAETQQLGMSAVGLTDHGNMHAAYDFYQRAVKAGVTPVLGIEAYVAPQSRFDKRRIRWGRPEQKDDDVSGGGSYTHATIWARNNEGLHNLFKLTSLASFEGHYIKWPRMDAELIAEHADGLIGTTGCPSGEVQTRLRDGLLDVGRRLNLPPVVTNDSHYTYESQAQSHDVLLCVQTASQLSDPNRFRFGGSGYYIKSAQETRAADSSEIWQRGCDNTLAIAERIDPAGMFTYRNLMPRFPIPEGQTEESNFRDQVWQGMARRFPGGYDETHRRQAEYEMDIIVQMGFPAYFLVVSDFIVWAKNNGVAVGPGRGSAAGSLVAYAMGITDLDPLPHGLIFEIDDLGVDIRAEQVAAQHGFTDVAHTIEIFGTCDACTASVRQNRAHDPGASRSPN
jgi:DNA polymerase-3 subunit alpha